MGCQAARRRTGGDLESVGDGNDGQVKNILKHLSLYYFSSLIGKRNNNVPVPYCYFSILKT